MMRVDEFKKVLLISGFMGVFIVLATCFLTGYVMPGVLTSQPRVLCVETSAERVVKADLVLWQLPFETRAETVEKALEKYQYAKKAILRFLEEHGFAADEYVINGPYIHDLNDKKDQREDTRFSIKSTISVRSHNIAHFRKALESTDMLIQRGVLLGSGYWNTKPRFLYTKFPELRIALLNDAITSAKHTARAIAQKQGLHLGKIKCIAKGQFRKKSLEAEYSEKNSYEKVIRFVGSVEFELK